MKTIDYSEGEKITIACIIGNIVLSILKLLAGIFGNSKAMISDALHSASDIIATLVVYIGIKIAGKPVDKEHPYGHGKVEPIAAFVIGIILVMAAIMIIKGIVVSIIEHSFSSPTLFALIAAVLSIVIKEIMFRVTYRAGKKINSESIMADAWHHRSDAFSSVATLIGIGGSMLGRRLGISQFEYMDPIAGAIVACFIFKVAYDILSRSVCNLMDSYPGDAKIQTVRETAMSVDGVDSVTMIKGRYIGQFLYIDMEILVNAHLSVEEGHALAALTRDKVINTVDDVSEVIVHVEPLHERDRQTVDSGQSI